VSRYLVGILFCLVIALAYAAFRDEAFQGLRHRKIRKRDIRQKQKGALNFWFYTELEKAYGLGKYGILLRLYPIVAGTFTVLHITFGWMDALALPDLILAGLTALYLSVLTLYACIRRNRRLFGQALLLLAWRETKNPVEKGRWLVPKSKNGNWMEYYSSVFDLILTVLPLVFPVLMGILDRL
jgi:hypothetical protein